MIRENLLKNKAFAEAQLWVFNGLSVMSLAFFFALFSAGSPDDFSFSLQLAAVLFGVSLSSNSFLASIIIFSEKNSDYLDMLNKSPYFGWVPIIAIYSSGLAVVCLVLSYSWFAFFSIVFTMAAVSYLWIKTMKHESEQHKKRMQELELEKLNTMAEILKDKKDTNSGDK
jgi:hypothetical protein